MIEAVSDHLGWEIFPLRLRPADGRQNINIVNELRACLKVFKKSKQEPALVPALDPGDDIRIQWMYFTGGIRW